MNSATKGRQIMFDESFRNYGRTRDDKVQILTIEFNIMNGFTVLMLEVFFDGSCIPNDRTGIPCYAFIVKKDDKTIYAAHGLAGKPNSNEATNSVAEYMALIKALEWLKENGYTSVIEGEISSPLFARPDGAQNKTGQDNISIKGDSALVVKQVTGKFKVRAPHIKPLHKKAMSLIVQFRNLNITLIPRESNSEADRLSYIAYKEARNSC